MTSVGGYREVGVSLVARALDCASVWLVERDVRGHLSVTGWDHAGVPTQGAGRVDDDLLVLMADLPVLRPVVDVQGAIVLALHAADGGLVGWRLVGGGRYGDADLEVAARMVSVLADPGMLDHPGRRATAALSVLTAREAEILSLVGEGLTARATARRCGISERTVQKHLEQAYRKLDCHDRLSAVLLARESGLLARGVLVPAT